MRMPRCGYRWKRRVERKLAARTGPAVGRGAVARPCNYEALTVILPARWTYGERPAIEEKLKETLYAHSASA
jgi:hypothetical protein